MYSENPDTFRSRVDREGSDNPETYLSPHPGAGWTGKVVITQIPT
jgi:hypothetical protein